MSVLYHAGFPAGSTDVHTHSTAFITPSSIMRDSQRPGEFPGARWVALHLQSEVSSVTGSSYGGKPRAIAKAGGILVPSVPGAYREKTCSWH